MTTRALESKRVKIWGNGQITIPLGIRRAYGLTKETIIRLEPEAQYISLIPEVSEIDRKKTIKSTMLKRKLSLADLLDGLEEERQASYKSYLKS